VNKTVPLHANGHWITRDRVGTVDLLMIEIGGEEVYYLDRAGMSYSCALCGKFIETRQTKDAVYVDDACPAAEGLTTVIRLEVPSGKIVVDDDLRPLFDGFDHDGFASYNSVLGQAQVVEAFAKQGCAFGPVGNSCPSLWKTGEDTYVIARMPYNDDEDAEDFDEPKPIPEGAQKLASICTDLWAYSIADYDNWLARGGVLVPKHDKATGETRMEPESWTTTIVEIPAGTYEFTFHGGELGFDDDKDYVVWTDIRKVA
jgi:hypothetical protein